MSATRRDLGAMLQQLLLVVIDAELPILERHGIEMWDYAVLGGLEHGSAQTQTELAAAVRRDKTRLIPILDRLEGRARFTQLAEAEPDIAAPHRRPGHASLSRADCSDCS